MKYKLYVVTVAMAILGGMSAEAQVPEMMNYQGRVVVDGTNYHGVGTFKFALVDAGTNTARTATATCLSAGGYVVSYTVTDGGAGYVTPPTVTVNDATGSGATATAYISGGAVTNIDENNLGDGFYSGSPTVTLSDPPVTLGYISYWSNDGTPSGEPTNAVSLTVNRGLFSVLLGNTNLANMTTLPGSVFANQDVRLRVWFNDGGGFEQLTPDQRIVSVAYAMKAGNGAQLDNVLNVGSGARYSSITEALAAITDNGPNSRYLIKVGPGTYNEPIINMKSYVEIEGSGEEVTTIWNTGVTNFNGSGAVIAASNSAISHLSIVCTNAETASGNYATCLFIADMGTNDFTAQHITCKAFGGYRATAVYCWYASPTLEHIRTQASGDKYSYGFLLEYSSATLNNVTATVWGSDWYDNAIDINQGAPRINNAVALSIGGGGGSWNRGVNVAGNAVLNNVTASAIGTDGQNIGIFCNGAEVLLTHCRITGQGSSGDNHGLYQFSATVKVHNSQIKGATTCLYVSNVASVTYAGGCQLDGPLTAEFSGTITTVLCYDENFAAIP